MESYLLLLIRLLDESTSMTNYVNGRIDLALKQLQTNPKSKQLIQATLIELIPIVIMINSQLLKLMSLAMGYILSRRYKNVPGDKLP